jgi:large subunit ribosomal protein L19
MNLLEEFERRQLRTSVPEFDIGDTIDVHVRIVEGDKQRIQIFTGTVIARKNAGNRSAFTVRRIVAGEGVERVFPLHSPWIERVEVKRRGRVRRAKLYYLRDRVGKSTKVRELIGGVPRRRKKPAMTAAKPEPAPAPEPEPNEADAAEAIAGSAES